MVKTVLDWYGNAIELQEKGDNPCVFKYGRGPEGRECTDCTHLYRKRYDKVYIKCDLRKHTNGPGSDHKAHWPVCARFEERSTKEEGK